MPAPNSRSLLRCAVALLASGAALALGFGGCASVVGLEHEYEPAAVSQGCKHAAWPLRPESTDANADDEEFVVAWRSLDFGEEDLSGGPTVGYDLDGVCSCYGDEGSCVAAEFVTADTCDGPGGRDNSAARLIAIIYSVAPGTSSAQTSANIEAGDWSLLVRVRGYNGESEDDQVDVSLYPSNGLDNDPCVPMGGTPSWDGNDRWPVPRLALLEGSGGAGGMAPDCSGATDGALDSPRWRDDAAYVRDGVLVGVLPEAGLTITDGNGPLSIVLTEGFLSAHIERDENGWRLSNGLLVGRWGLVDALSIAPRFRVDGEPICTDHTVYPLLKNAVCSVADITAGVSGPSAECDAMSFGVAFEAEQAQLGTVVETPPEQYPCPPETDPRLDTCAVP
jgi:hypothetical protein